MAGDSVRIREVGPRDGLQVEKPLAPEARVRLIEALVAAGVTDLEAVAFVSPRAVPAMDGAAEVLASFSAPGVTRWALVPNRRGAEAAVAAGADALSMTASASEEYSQRNVRMSVERAVAEVAEVAGVAGGLPVDVVVSCAFGSPYEGDVEPADVARLVERVEQQGATSVTLADTTGMASPRRLRAVLDLTGPGVGLHLHETRGTALVNAYAALQAGVRRFDTSVGGLGGSPFAAGAAGNLATEELVYLLAEEGYRSGVDLGGLLDAARLVAEMVGHGLPSRLAATGPRLARGSATETG